MDEIDHPILDGKHLHPKFDDTDHPDSDESNSCYNIIQNWMTLIIQIRMKVTVINNIQNWMISIIQIWMKVTVVNIIKNWMTLIIQIWIQFR